jgi:hypothetical protein
MLSFVLSTFQKKSEIFFPILTFFNQYLRNEPGQKLFLNLGLLSHVSLSGVTYEGVMPVHMTWLTFIWTSAATSIRSVPPHILVPKISHVILNCVTMSHATPLGAWLILGQSAKSVLIIIYCFSITKNKYLTCFKIYTDIYTYRIEHGEQFLLLTQVQILHRLITKIP